MWIPVLIPLASDMECQTYPRQTQAIQMRRVFTSHIDAHFETKDGLLDVAIMTIRNGSVNGRRGPGKALVLVPTNALRRPVQRDQNVTALIRHDTEVLC